MLVVMCSVCQENTIDNIKWDFQRIAMILVFINYKQLSHIRPSNAHSVCYWLPGFAFHCGVVFLSYITVRSWIQAWSSHRVFVIRVPVCMLTTTVVGYIMVQPIFFTACSLLAKRTSLDSNQPLVCLPSSWWPFSLLFFTTSDFVNFPTQHRLFILIIWGQGLCLWSNHGLKHHLF